MWFKKSYNWSELFGKDAAKSAKCLYKLALSRGYQKDEAIKIVANCLDVMSFPPTVAFASISTPSFGIAESRDATPKILESKDGSSEKIEFDTGLMTLAEYLDEKGVVFSGDKNRGLGKTTSALSRSNGLPTGINNRGDNSHKTYCRKALDVGVFGVSVHDYCDQKKYLFSNNGIRAINKKSNKLSKEMGYPVHFSNIQKRFIYAPQVLEKVFENVA
jgi:hypothetical protein